MDVRTDRESDAVAVVTISPLCYWLIKSYFDIWNSASRASLTKMKESISCSLGHDNRHVEFDFTKPVRCESLEITLT